MKKITSLILILLISGFANAVVITFDEEHGVFDHSGYHDLLWNGFNRIHTPTYHIQNSGYIRGNVSPEYTAFTVRGANNPATVRSVSGFFDFTGMYITAAWQFNLGVYLEGYVGNNRLYSQSFSINDDAPTFTNSNFIGINRLNIYTVAGIDAYTPGSGAFVAIDNFTVSDFYENSQGGGSSGNGNSGNVSVTEPGSITLLGLGLLGIGICRRKTKSC